MRRTFALVSVALASIAAAAIAPRIRPSAKLASGPLQVTAQVNRDGYLQIDLTANGDNARRHRVPVNAVLILDRSGSMTGSKIDRARDAARALVNALGESDSFAMIEFGSDASVLFPASPMKPENRAQVLDAIDRLG